MVEPIDEVAIQNLQTYKEKKFVDISKEDLELGLYCFLLSFALILFCLLKIWIWMWFWKHFIKSGDEDEVKERENKQEYNLLCDWIKQQLGEKVAKVQISKRLSSSPCVLVSGKFGWSANMERLVITSLALQLILLDNKKSIILMA